MGLPEGVSPMGIVGFLVLAIAFLLQLIGFAAPYWVLTKTRGSIQNYFGLWRYCVIRECTAHCMDSTERESLDVAWFKATQAFSCLGFIALLVAVLVALLSVFFLKDKKILNIVGAGASIAGGGFTFLAVVIFGAKLNDIDPTGSNKYTDNLHASFGLSIVAFILAAMAGVLLFVGGMKK